MQIDGECHCGRISYRAEVDPNAIYLCHCADCQAISGSPYRWAVPVSAERFKLLSGKPKTYVKTSEVGRMSHQLFCSECASPIYSTVPGKEPATFNLRLGTARQRDQLRPQLQSWCRSAQEWAKVAEARCIDTQ